MKPLLLKCIAASLAGIAAVPGTLAAVERMHGAFFIDGVNGAITLKEPGEAPIPLGPDTEPQMAGSVLNLELPGQGSVFIRASNGAAMWLGGPGEFSVERFVQEVWSETPAPYEEGATEPSESRMVLNLREGELVFDGSRQAVGTRLGLETPIGSLLAGPAIWAIEIEHDPRNRIYNFSLRLKGGEVKFTDRRGRSFRLYPGQQLSGVGSSGSPAIEIGELEENGMEAFSMLESARSRTSASTLDWEDFQSAMLPVAERVETRVFSSKELVSEEGRRPITIEFVPRVPEPIPFRGLVRPPEAYEEQLF